MNDIYSFSIKSFYFFIIIVFTKSLFFNVRLLKQKASLALGF